MREVRLLNEQELQWAVNVAGEVFEICLKNHVTEQERQRYQNYVLADNLWQGICAGRLFLWGVFEEGNLCAVGAIQNDGLITMLCVRPACQHRGMGSALLYAMCSFLLSQQQAGKVIAYVTPVTAAPFFYQRGFVLEPDGAKGDGYAVVSFDPSAQGQSIPRQKAPRREVSYPIKKVPTKVILGVTALVLILCFTIISAISVHHLAAERMYTKEDLYSTEQENRL